MSTKQDNFNAQLERALQPLAGQLPAGPGRDAALRRARHARLTQTASASGPRWKLVWLAVPAACVLLAVGLFFISRPPAESPGVKVVDAPAEMVSTEATALVYRCKTADEARDTQQRLSLAIDKLNEDGAQRRLAPAEVALVSDEQGGNAAALLLSSLSLAEVTSLQEALSSETGLGPSFQARATVFSSARDWHGKPLSASLVMPVDAAAGTSPICYAWPSSLSEQQANLLQNLPVEEPSAEATAAGGPAVEYSSERAASLPLQDSVEPAEAPAAFWLGLRPYDTDDGKTVLDDAMKTYLGLPSAYWDCDVLLEEIVPGSPAASAGLRKGDMLLAITVEPAAGGVKAEPCSIGSVLELRKLLLSLAGTERLHLTYLHEGQVLSTSCSPAPRPLPGSAADPASSRHPALDYI